VTLLYTRWPEQIAGQAKSTGPYDPCRQCGRGTWVRYGGQPICYECATGEALPAPRAAPLGTEVSLDEDEQARLAALARARAAHDRRMKIRDQRVDLTRSDAAVDLTAIGVHYGWCRCLGAAFNDTTRGTDRYLVQPPGHAYALQSRASVHARGHLIFLPGEEIVGDVIGFGVSPALARGVLLVGWITRAEFTEQHVLRDFGLGVGEQPAVDQSALSEPCLLPGWIGLTGRTPVAAREFSDW
jgi:hypothetical protein